MFLLNYCLCVIIIIALCWNWSTYFVFWCKISFIFIMVFSIFFKQSIFSLVVTFFLRCFCSVFCCFVSYICLSSSVFLIVLFFVLSFLF